MNLYKSHCYATLQEVADSIQSSPDIGAGYMVSSAVVSGSNVAVTANFGASVANYTVSPPTCSQVGFNNSYSGLTVADSLELWGLALLVMATAFSIKVIKRAL